MKINNSPQQKRRYSDSPPSASDIIEGQLFIGGKRLYSKNNSGTIFSLNDVDEVETISVLLYYTGLCKTVIVSGYWSKGDGGGGTFVYDETKAGINNGGTIINGWVRVYNGAINMAWFGAVGSGDESALWQTVIDLLPSNGGTIIVNGLDFSSTVSASITVAPTKMVIIELHNGAVMPASFPCAVISQGDRLHPHEGGLGAGNRVGSAYSNIIATHSVREDQPNQQDSIYYAEGELIPPKLRKNFLILFLLTICFKIT